ncbi:hypothetical protein A262_19674, partial [Pseudomonas syringae pv. actinidiae ICMP 19073]
HGMGGRMTVESAEQFISSASEAELTHLVQSLRSGDAGKQVAFGHVVARYAEQLLAS